MTVPATVSAFVASFGGKTFSSMSAADQATWVRLYEEALARAAAAPTFPIPGLVKTFEPDLTAPLSLYDRLANPGGLFKPNLWFGGDGESHSYMEQWSVWPDAASSRAGGSDLQTYSDQAYNAVNPFSAGPDGLSIAIAKNPAVTALTPGAYTGGLVTTQFSFAQRYGYFEAAMTWPALKGSWPAFWLLGLPQSEYQSDEIDIAEGLGGTQGVVYQNAHAPRLSWNAPSVSVPNVGPSFTAGFLWTPSTLSWFVNGQQTSSCPNPGFHHPMYVLLDHAVGPKDGGWAALNTPVDDASLPAKMTAHSLTAWRLP